MLSTCDDDTSWEASKVGVENEARERSSREEVSQVERGQDQDRVRDRTGLGLGSSKGWTRVATGLGTSRVPRSGGCFIKQSVLYDWPAPSPISRLDASPSRRFATETRSSFDGTSSSPSSPLLRLRAFLVPCLSLFFPPLLRPLSACVSLVSPTLRVRRIRRDEKPNCSQQQWSVLYTQALLFRHGSRSLHEPLSRLVYSVA